MESSKFGRQYFLTALNTETNQTTVKAIGLPFTTKFAINRTWGITAGNGTIQIYNLNKDTRSFLRKDSTDITYHIWVSLTAGYGSEVSTLIEGWLQLGFSSRQGVDYITTLQVSDLSSAYKNATFSSVFRDNTTVGTVIRTLAKAMEEYGIKLGKVSTDFSGKLKRGNSLSGRAVDLLNEQVGGQFVVNNGVLNVMADDQYIEGEILQINSKYGLLGKPRREGQNVVLSLLLESRAYVGQRVIIALENDEDDFNGNYITRSLSHNGTISETIGETATTELFLTMNKFARKL